MGRKQASGGHAAYVKCAIYDPSEMHVYVLMSEIHCTHGALL